MTNTPARRRRDRAVLEAQTPAVTPPWREYRQQLSDVSGFDLVATIRESVAAQAERDERFLSHFRPASPPPTELKEHPCPATE